MVPQIMFGIDHIFVSSSFGWIFGWPEGIGRRRFGALDHEPEHEGQFSEKGGLGVEKHLALVLRHQYARKAEGHVGESIDGEPDAEEPRQQARLVGKRR
jgi:hypothetical protein